MESASKEICGTTTQELPAYFKLSFLLTVWRACLCPTRDVLNLWGSLILAFGIIYHYDHLQGLCATVQQAPYPRYYCLFSGRLPLLLWNQSGELSGQSLVTKKLGNCCPMHAVLCLCLPDDSERGDGWWCSERAAPQDLNFGWS